MARLLRQYNSNFGKWSEFSGLHPTLKTGIIKETSECILCKKKDFFPQKYFNTEHTHTRKICFICQSKKKKVIKLELWGLIY